MGRKATKCRKTCKNHLFSLKPLHYSAYFSKEVVVSFCPPTLKDHPVLPVFNTDRKYYTSTFSLKEDQKKYQLNDSIYKTEHEKCCQAQNNGKSEMLIPKPRSKCQYCHACKEYYEDYRDHIATPDHKDRAKRNKFSGYIEELINDRYPRVEENNEDFQQNCQQSSNQIDKDVATSQSIGPTEPNKNSYRFLSGQGAFQLHGHNLKRCDSFRLTIGSEGNKQFLSPHQMKNFNPKPQHSKILPEENRQTNMAAMNSGFYV